MYNAENPWMPLAAFMIGFADVNPWILLNSCIFHIKCTSAHMLIALQTERESFRLEVVFHYVSAFIFV